MMKARVTSPRLGELGSIRPETSYYPIARSGSLLGFVAEDGSLSLPILGVDEERYLGDLTTIRAVAAAAAESVFTIEFETPNWYLQRN